MIARVLLATLIAAALWSWQRSLDPLRLARTEARGIQLLAPAEKTAGRSIAGLSLSRDGHGHTYFQRDGQWRCASALGAIALKEQVESVVRDLLEAAGPVRRFDPGKIADYGFGAGKRLEVTLHGPRLFEDPERDVVLACELGSTLPDRGRCFARALGSERMLEIQRNPRALLESGDSLPPLLDRRVLAGEWPQPNEGLVRAFVDFDDGRSIELRLRQLPAEERRPGQPAQEWTASEDGERSRCNPYRIAGWQSFLLRVPYRGFANPREAGRDAFDPEPRARVTLVLAGAGPIELSVGRLAENGLTFVANAKTGMLCLVDAGYAPLFAPTTAMLTETTIANPWEAWLRQ